MYSIQRATKAQSSEKNAILMVPIAREQRKIKIRLIKEKECGNKEKAVRGQ